MQVLPPCNRLILTFNLPIYGKKTWSSFHCGMMFSVLLRKLLFVAVEKRLNSSHLLFCPNLLERDFLLTFKGKDSVQFLFNACVKVTLFKTNPNSVIWSISFATHRLEGIYFLFLKFTFFWSKAGDGEPRIGSIRKTFHFMENPLRGCQWYCNEET